MQVLGLDVRIGRSRAAQLSPGRDVVPAAAADRGDILLADATRDARGSPLRAAGTYGGLWSAVGRWFDGGGSFQQDVEIRRDRVLAQTTVFACATQIAGDVGKLGLQLTEKQNGGTIWTPADNGSFSPVLRVPNGYQTRQQLIETWLLSKLLHGNTYVLLVRDASRIAREMHVLDPRRVMPLVGSDGSVWYELQPDDLAAIPDEPDYRYVVPARDVIHDRFNCFFHPLVGLSPIFACGLSAMQAHEIATNSANFFRRRSRPGGVITAPARIDDKVLTRIKQHIDSEYTGAGAGSTLVLGDAMTYQPIGTSPVDAQLVQQLELSSKQVCSTFHVPGFLVGVEPMPALANVQAAMLLYYVQCLQTLIEGVENCLDKGLGIGAHSRSPESAPYRTALDTENDLLRMDSRTLAEVEGIKLKGISASNESRAKFNLPPVEGGDEPLTQQQNYSLKALAKRDAREDPFASGGGAAPAPQAGGDQQTDSDGNPVDSDGNPIQGSDAAQRSAVVSFGGMRAVAEARREAELALDRARRAENDLAALQVEADLGALALALAAALEDEDGAPDGS